MDPSPMPYRFHTFSTSCSEVDAPGALLSIVHPPPVVDVHGTAALAA